MLEFVRLSEFAYAPEKSSILAAEYDLHTTYTIWDIIPESGRK